MLVSFQEAIALDLVDDFPSLNNLDRLRFISVETKSSNRIKVRFTVAQEYFYPAKLLSRNIYSNELIFASNLQVEGSR